MVGVTWHNPLKSLNDIAEVLSTIVSQNSPSNYIARGVIDLAAVVSGCIRLCGSGGLAPPGFDSDPPGPECRGAFACDQDHAVAQSDGAMPSIFGMCEVTVLIMQ